MDALTAALATGDASPARRRPILLPTRRRAQAAASSAASSSLTSTLCTIGCLADGRYQTIDSGDACPDSKAQLVEVNLASRPPSRLPSCPASKARGRRRGEGSEQPRPQILVNERVEIVRDGELRASSRRAQDDLQTAESSAAHAPRYGLARYRTGLESRWEAILKVSLESGVGRRL